MILAGSFREDLVNVMCMIQVGFSSQSRLCVQSRPAAPFGALTQN
jgi:hypothetical protein